MSISLLLYAAPLYTTYIEKVFLLKSLAVSGKVCTFAAVFKKTSAIQMQAIYDSEATVTPLTANGGVKGSKQPDEPLPIVGRLVANEPAIELLLTH